MLKLVLVFSLVGILFAQSNLGLNSFTFAEIANTADYEPSADKFTVTIDSEGKYIDSGYRVSDTDGEVLIRRGDQPNAWENAFSGDIIYEGDVLFTTKDTEGTIVFPDQVTLHMQAQTELFFDFNDQRKQLNVIYGKILFDFEEDNKQPSMNFDLSKASVTTEDSILICESNASSSRVLVLAGEAEVKDQNEIVAQLFANEEVMSQESGNENVKTFSAESELLEWTSDIRNKVNADIASRQSKLTDVQLQETTITDDQENSNYDTTSIIKLFTVLILVVGAIYFVLSKRNK